MVVHLSIQLHYYYYSLLLLLLLIVREWRFDFGRNGRVNLHVPLTMAIVITKRGWFTIIIITYCN